MAESMVAHLRQHLTSEHESAQRGLYGLAAVASHQSITARMERAWQRVQTLHAAGNDQQAQELLFSDAFYEGCEETECTKGAVTVTKEQAQGTHSSVFDPDGPFERSQLVRGE